MKKIVADWVLARDAAEIGQLVSMTNIVERKRTDLNNELNKYFKEQLPNYNAWFDEYEGEEILYNLNTYIEENNIDKYRLDFPYTNSTDVHLLKVNKNIQIKILIADEYHGGGEYSKYVSIGSFVITEDTSRADVDELIEFLKKYVIQ